MAGVIKNAFKIIKINFAVIFLLASCLIFNCIAHKTQDYRKWFYNLVDEKIFDFLVVLKVLQSIYFAVEAHLTVVAEVVVVVVVADIENFAADDDPRL